jgi:hypothetical protein
MHRSNTHRTNGRASPISGTAPPGVFEHGQGAPFDGRTPRGERGWALIELNPDQVRQLDAAV